MNCFEGKYCRALVLCWNIFGEFFLAVFDLLVIVCFDSIVLKPSNYVQNGSENYFEQRIFCAVPN
jgi:hypothetical protein